MTQQLVCPGCGKVLQVGGLFGRRFNNSNELTCPNCSLTITLDTRQQQQPQQSGQLVGSIKYPASFGGSLQQAAGEVVGQAVGQVIVYGLIFVIFVFFVAMILL
jgi:hypothetical protein